MVEDGIWGSEVAEVEGAEKPVAGAGAIVTHGVDNFLEVLGVGAPEGDTPFPVVEAEGGGDELGHFAGEGHPAGGMFGHEFTTLGERKFKPIGTWDAGLAHGVKAHHGPIGEFGSESMLVHRRQASGVGGDFGLKVGGGGIFTAGDQSAAVLFLSG